MSFRPMRLIVLMLMAISLFGCDSPDARFRLNMVYLAKNTRDVSLTDEQVQNVADTLTAMFGTPDDPYIPVGGDSGIDQVLDIANLEMAAGPVSSNQAGKAHGLFREHCVHCHGISGDGLGPTAAFLNPYPRDYRKGTFKFKTTPKGVRPTDEDLKRILTNGIPGTAMPSFRLLADDELDALVDYVKYLSIRGEVERRFVQDLVNEYDEGELLESSAEYLLNDVLASIAQRWAQAQSQVPSVPPKPEWNEEERLASIQRGKELFHGQIAICTQCHGETALGDGQVNDYDDWTDDFEDFAAAMDPAEREEKMERLVDLGGLMPRPIVPRNLRQGVYRGGRRPVDIYLRIVHGIDGTPMPGASMQPAISTGLSSEDVWCLVEYVLSLPYEALSRPRTSLPTNTRMRSS